MFSLTFHSNVYFTADDIWLEICYTYQKGSEGIFTTFLSGPYCQAWQIHMLAVTLISEVSDIWQKVSVNIVTTNIVIMIK